jgi:GEVED domain-containing protein
MKKARIILSVIVITVLGFSVNWAINTKDDTEKPDSRIDNMGYWKKVAKKGLVAYNPDVKVKSAVFTGSKIRAITVSTLDSPDVPVADENSVQSENSIFINPLDETNILNSNNSASNPVSSIYGANSLYSINSATTWDGSVEGAGEDNGGDPAAIIGLNGRWYVNYINNGGGMGVSYSDDQGQSWVVKNATPNPDIVTDKNHMWIDNNPDSPYEGNLYVAWSNFGDLNLAEIGISYSTDNGETWTVNNNISSAVSAGSHNQGVNLSTGPNGEVYAIWAIYDTWVSGGSDEIALGMAVSFDGGASWELAKRIISNIRGIRASKTSKNMRVNSFPVADVDNSNSADKGTIYAAWTNIGTPGINTGNDIDIYLIKSVDKGESWSTPVKVNQDDPGLGNEHYLPWLTCDPTHGILSMIFYDDRNVGSDQCEVFCANSVDGGSTWEDFKVSDVSFTPAPIPGLVASYMGDYLGIHAKNGVVYPVWTDNRLGYAMSFCSPYQTNPVNRPINLEGEVTFETGEAQLYWSYEYASGFEAFIVYRDGDSIASTSDTTFSHILPEYGVYRYRVTALYSGDIESGASGIELQWGGVEIEVNPDIVSDHLAIGDESEHFITIKNNGQLNLEYYIKLNSYMVELNSSKIRTLEYCTAHGGSEQGQEYISGVEVGDISNLNTGNDNYVDYSNLSTSMQVGTNYEITVTNGEPFDLDQCGVWIDWDIDGIFDDDEITVLTGINGTETFKGTLSPPPGSVTGSAKMRVRLTYTGALNACGGANFGEVEDYTVLLKGWLDMIPLSGSILPGDSSLVSVNFNATDLPADDYFTNAIIYSNDPDRPVLEIPISLRADSIVVHAFADPEMACLGSVIAIRALVSGDFDSISYTWTSNPEGFISTKARAFAISVEPTWYISKIYDGDNMSTDSVFVDVIDTPVVDIGADTSLCGSVDLTLDAQNPGSRYLWSTGDTTQKILIDTAGNGYGIQALSVEVTSPLGCMITDQINIDFVNCTGVSENSKSDITVYPNPNKGLFRLRTGLKASNIYTLKIINTSGIVVYNNQDVKVESNGDIKIELFGVSPGYYTAILGIDNTNVTIGFIITR